VSKAYVDRAETALAELGDDFDGADAAAIRKMCEEARRWLDAAN